MSNSQIETYTFYDLETFGTDPCNDRIVQFAAIRTDTDFNPIEQKVIYCKPPVDYLPKIEAIVLTGITPAFAAHNGLSENVFMTEVNNFLSRPNNCVLGYNSIFFDDEFIRYSALRNFINPYEFNSFNGSSRWDVFNVVKICCALCPEGINWHYLPEEQRYSLKLTDLSSANGLCHDHAHDALSDVIATIEVLKLIKNRQPQMYNYLFSHRTRREILDYLVDNDDGSLPNRALLTVNSIFGPQQMFVGAVLPVCLDRDQRNLYCWNLHQSIEDFNDLPTIEELDCSAVRMTELGIIKIKLGSCPILLPLTILNKNNRSQRVNIDLNCVKAVMDYLQQNDLKKDYLKEVIAKFEAYYQKRYGSGGKKVAETDLYGSTFDDLFIDKENKLQVNRIQYAQQHDPNELGNISFNSPALNEMLLRFKARNYPQLLTADETAQWQEHLNAYNQENGSRFVTELNDVFINNEKNQAVIALLKDTATYYGITG